MQNFHLLLLFFMVYSHRVEQTMGQMSPSSTKCRSPNEEFAVDPMRPQNTCETYGCYGEFKCPGSSKTEGGCYCKKGYARLVLNGPCISILDARCAPKLPPTSETCSSRENEVYDKYVSNRQCANTCRNYKVNCPVINTLVATWGPRCECKVGYARLPNGKCVLVDDSKCMELYKPSAVQCKLRGEVFRIGQICESIPSCQYPKGPPFVCMAIGPMARCYCRDGYLRNNNGVCVLKSKC